MSYPTFESLYLGQPQAAAVPATQPVQQAQPPAPPTQTQDMGAHPWANQFDLWAQQMPPAQQQAGSGKK